MEWWQIAVLIWVGALALVFVLGARAALRPSPQIAVRDPRPDLLAILAVVNGLDDDWWAEAMSILLLIAQEPPGSISPERVRELMAQHPRWGR